MPFALAEKDSAVLGPVCPDRWPGGQQSFLRADGHFQFSGLEIGRGKVGENQEVIGPFFQKELEGVRGSSQTKIASG